MGKREYSEETKAAVMAALLQGQSLNQVAAEYKIPKSTVANWSADARKNISGTVPNPKRERIGELIIEYLQASLEALIVQTKVFGDKEWLRKQEASDLAVLHGVGVDKAFRIAEALASDSATQE